MVSITKAKAFVADLVKMRENATDALSSIAVNVYPTLKGNGELISVGTKILHSNKIFKAAVDLWDTNENTPENAPNLWEELQYKDGYRIIPDTITVTSAFALNELGWWKDKLYKSLLESNVYTPEQYASGWEEVVT